MIKTPIPPEAATRTLITWILMGIAVWVGPGIVVGAGMALLVVGPLVIFQTPTIVFGIIQGAMTGIIVGGMWGVIRYEGGVVDRAHTHPSGPARAKRKGARIMGRALR